jgi:hypothetical protein
MNIEYLKDIEAYLEEASEQGYTNFNGMNKKLKAAIYDSIDAHLEQLALKLSYDEEFENNPPSHRSAFKENIITKILDDQQRARDMNLI